MKLEQRLEQILKFIIDKTDSAHKLTTFEVSKATDFSIKEVKQCLEILQSQGLVKYTQSSFLTDNGSTDIYFQAICKTNEGSAYFYNKQMRRKETISNWSMNLFMVFLSAILGASLSLLIIKISGQ